MWNIKLLNPVSPVWLEVIREEEFHLGPQAEAPAAVIVRSADMHGYALNPQCLAVGRAGVGVNNIPLEEYARQGVVVFNSPGANANAVKELTLAGLLLASRDITGGASWAQGLKGQGDQVEALVEKGKKAFAGPEIAGKTLGVIGLGAIGLLVANAGAALGMQVLGYDPYISVDNAWKLSRAVRHARSEEEVAAQADYLTLHVPLTKETRGKLNAGYLAHMKPGAALLNFSRGELADTDAVISALESSRLRAYVCDFPCEKLLGVPHAVCLPHLGASTPESEENCVRMIARQLEDYLKRGAIAHSVNYPDADPGPLTGPRLTILHQNVPHVVSGVTSLVSAQNLNINQMLNQSRGVFAYTALDLDETPDGALLSQIGALETVYRVRLLTPQ